MRIAFIGQKNSLTRASRVEKNIPEIAVHMAKRGHEVFVFVQKEIGAKKIQNYRGVKIISIPKFWKSGSGNFSYVFWASVHSLFCKYDIVHFVFPKEKFSMIAMKFLQKFRRLVAAFKPFVGTSIRFSKNTNKISHWQLKDKKYVLTVGKLNKESGVHLLVEAFKQLEDTARTSNNFKLVIVGDDSKNDEYLEYLKTISESRSNIVFAGKKTGETLEQLYSHAYLFVNPSELDESSRESLQAMAHGLSVLAGNTKENLEVIGESGFFFSAKSIFDLRSKLAFLLSRSDEIKRTGILAKKRVRTHFGWECAVKKMIDEYNLILNKSHGQD